MWGFCSSVIEMGFTTLWGAIMGFHSSTGTAALLALAMALGSAKARGAEDDASGEPAPIRCGECRGWGKTDCPACRGTRLADGPCKACTGSGVKRCTRAGCHVGRVKCNSCGGSGRKITYGAGIGGRTQVDPCPSTVPCRTCGGTANVVCKKCRFGLVKVDCDPCGASGKVKCSGCGGKGTFEVIPPPPMEVDPEFIKSQVERARSSLELIDASAKSLKALRTRSEAVRVKGPELDRKVDSLRKEIGEDTALRGEAALLEDKWSACGRSRASVDERLQNADAKAQAGRDAARRL
jgi:hypothetical protein